MQQFDLILDLGETEIQNGEPFWMIWLSLPGESTHTVLGNNPAWMDRGWSPGLFDYVLVVAPEGLVALPVITPGRFRCKEQRDPGRVAPHFSAQPKEQLACCYTTNPDGRRRLE